MGNSIKLNEYISRVKELEISCYQQKMFCNHLKGTLVHLNKSKSNIGGLENKTRPDTLSTKILSVLGSVGVCLLWGALIGLVVGLVIAGIVLFIRFIRDSSSDNIVYSLFLAIKSIFSADLGEVGKCLLNGILKGLLYGGIVGALFGIIIGFLSFNTKKRARKINDKIEEKNQIITQKTYSLSKQIDAVTQSLALAERTYEETVDILREYYKLNIIYPKYRGIVPVTMFDEYLSSGRCSTLEGHEGAYNIYENEIRLNLILTKLDDIIVRLDQIADNQYMLAKAIRDSRKKTEELASSINHSLQDIKDNTTISKYYNDITARNTSYLAWMTYLRS